MAHPGEIERVAMQFAATVSASSSVSGRRWSVDGAALPPHPVSRFARRWLRRSRPQRGRGRDWWIVVLGAIVGVTHRRTCRDASGSRSLDSAPLLHGPRSVSSGPNRRSAPSPNWPGWPPAGFRLALNAYGRDAVRRTVYSAPPSVIGALALLSRLHPPWFPANETRQGSRDRGRTAGFPGRLLERPRSADGDWHAAAPAIAVNSRRIATQALATASVPVMALVAFYTLSRGGAIEIGVGLLAFVVLSRNDFKSCQASRSQGWEARC